MKYTSICVFAALLIFAQNTATTDDWQKSAYFDTHFLAQPAQVKQLLINDGFSEVTFDSLDGYQIKGLFRVKEHARTNILLAAGFYPGYKEGMATFAKLLPDDCNILFIDARGHGESSGPFWSNILWYGNNEYKDIVGALSFLCAQNKLPNLLLGVCIGAFHCTHAALFLEQHKSAELYNLQGVVFDSGFGSITDLKWVPGTHFNDKTLPHIFTSLLYTQDNKKMVKQRWLYKATALVASLCASAATYAVSPFLYMYNHQTNLFDKIHKLHIPLLYIHCENDSYAPIGDVKRLANSSHNSSCWWIEQSQHACNHLKHKVVYKDHLLEFINNCVHT